MAEHRPVEAIKADSRRLRGTLVESLAEPATGALAADDTVLLKFHGSYQQDDRDLREERRRQKLEPDWRFMIRTRTPGGVLSPSQWLAMDAIARDHAGGALRLTSRQAVQFHGVIKHRLKATLAAINAALIDTLAACGDVNRNVLVAANPLLSALHAELYADAAALSEHLLPRSRAYHEIWLDGEKLADSGREDEPLYGPCYLPRKFKTAFAIPPHNDVDVLAQDLGFVAIVEHGALAGYDLTVGGGMGASHGDPQTYPLLARPLGFVRREQVLAIAEAVLTTQRDFGNREQRKRARLKYTIEDRGLDWFRGEVARRAGFAPAPARGFSFRDSGDRYGWVEGGDARWHLTLHLPAGRVVDREHSAALTGLATIARRLARAGRGHFRITPNQNLIVADVDAALREAIDALVADHGLDAHVRLAPSTRAALACVALPTCSLAMAEAERWLPALAARFESLLDAHGLAGEEVQMRVSGCPNGCSRPYLAEIALIGKGPGRYQLMLGGDGRGQRLARSYRDNLDEDAIHDALDRLLARWSAQREPGERFGDFVHRIDPFGPPVPESE